MLRICHTKSTIAMHGGVTAGMRSPTVVRTIFPELPELPQLHDDRRLSWLHGLHRMFRLEGEAVLYIQPIIFSGRVRASFPGILLAFPCQHRSSSEKAFGTQGITAPPACEYLCFRELHGGWCLQFQKLLQ